MSVDTQLAWLEALSVAFPLTSEDAFARRLIKLDRSVWRRGSTAPALSEEALNALRAHGSGASLDALSHVIERVWLPRIGGPESVSLGDMLGRFALRVVPHRWALPSPEPAHVAAERWRWAVLALPPDLLVGAARAYGGSGSPASTVTNATLARLLERPVANVHLHLSAAISFPTLWLALMRAVGEGVFQSPALASLERVPFGSPARFSYRLLGASLARVFLTAFLRRPPSAPGDFRAFAQTVLPSGRIALTVRPHAAAVVREGLRALCGGERSGPGLSRRVQRLALAVYGSRWRAVETMSQLQSSDPLSRGSRASSESGEERLVCAALKRMQSVRDDEFAVVLWQYLRVRAQTYRFLVQEPGTSGLGWFVRFFERLSALAKPIDSKPGLQMESALELESEGVNLRSLEVRAQPKKSWSANMALARAVLGARSAASGAAAERGVVLHFVKSSSRSSDQSPSLRYSAWARDAMERAEALARTMSIEPRSVVVIRGIDAANEELSVPAWVLAPIFARVRSASIEAANRVRRQSPGLGARCFQATFHAGEDFRTPIEGLRRVAELMDFGILGPGDRRGHAGAAGVPVSALTRRADRWLQPREERLFDLLWEIDVCRRGVADTGRALGATHEAEAHAHGCLGEWFRWSELLEARRRMHDPRWLRSIGFPRRANAPRASDKPSHIAWRLIASRTVEVHAREPIEVAVTAAEMRAAETLQQLVRWELCERGLVVETNPSSNRLIGDQGDLTSHPALGLRPPLAAAPTRRVRVAIGDDDPLTFSTSLAAEFAVMHSALRSVGCDEAAAHVWLEDARQAAWDGRFTLPVTGHARARRALLRALRA